MVAQNNRPNTGKNRLSAWLRPYRLSQTSEASQPSDISHSEAPGVGAGRSLRRIALIVAVATALSKVAGLVRQQVIAAAFGVGIAYDAYNYAYVLPGFLLILLGGINGPFHSAMVSVLARRPREEGAHVLAAINTLVGAVLIGVTLLLFLAADPLIDLVGPGLDAERHAIAVLELRWMAPMALFAGLIGLGFGALNAADEFWLPSVSPLLSSVAVIAGLGILWAHLGSAIALPQYAAVGGAVLAGTTLLGAVFQWLIQLPALAKQGLHKFQLVWDWKHPGVQEVLQVMGPATLSSGMLQINVFTDLFFASGIVGAAAGLGYANLLVQTPLGLLSNALLVPLLPVFARLTAPADRPELVGRIRQGLMLSSASMLPLGALMVGLAGPIVALVYERGAFNASAAALVGGLLMAYGVGMPAYLGRDVLVRVFYALGDGTTPFRFSMAGIGLNVIFDWLLVGGPTPWGLQVPALNFGAPGLVLATVAVNVITCLGLLLALQQRLGGLPLRVWGRDTLLLLGAAVLAGLAAWGLSEGIGWPSHIWGLLIQCAFCSGVGLLVYGLLASWAGVPEARELSRQLRQRLPGLS
ncbi:murein biosynthesis integral membrane protein MurJ [Synechococcus sp. HJ21-Hayes]|uniref:murein biosynthesis integral membrane protein MurJ n=1 Tax=Synechococcus sp. HJ21-Hayes TaxID=2823736 RepID=UPI0020CF984F|nr:murein biosynthesis integral membrane protein MurJ [Synechococcus sp. HJ21-Hayes]MCP9852934.1 murein biosynthesis integral membrane protein MurJ [Synechococcus sp. HJ21-Hayes]